MTKQAGTAARGQAPIMRYITKVGDTHVIEINGTNHQVVERESDYTGCEDGELQFHFNNCRIAPDFSVNLEENRVHLAAIVLAVEVAKFIKDQTEK